MCFHIIYKLIHNCSLALRAGEIIGRPSTEGSFGGYNGPNLGIREIKYQYLVRRYYVRVIWQSKTYRYLLW